MASGKEPFPWANAAIVTAAVAILGFVAYALFPKSPAHPDQPELVTAIEEAVNYKLDVINYVQNNEYFEIYVIHNGKSIPQDEGDAFNEAVEALVAAEAGDTELLVIAFVEYRGDKYYVVAYALCQEMNPRLCQGGQAYFELDPELVLWVND